MTESERTAENLKAVRSLADRAEYCRVISARTALIGGLTSLAVSIWMLRRAGVIGASDRIGAFTTRDFIWPWLIALLITLAANIFFVGRETRRSHRKVESAGLRLAMRCIFPAVFVAAAITFVGWRNPSDLEGPTILGLTWIACYGLALLATQTFAPRALVVLGGSFLVSAVLWLLILSSPALPPIEELRGYVGSNFAMGLTFGFFHLLYAILNWRSRKE